MVLSIVAILIVSPVLGSLAQAGSINYEGIRPITIEDGHDTLQHRGIMFKFSFSSPKEYLKRKSLQEEDVLKRDAKINKVGGYALFVVAVGMFIAIEANDD
jgi:hypothetical protein